MTAILTPIDDTYGANLPDGTKRLRFTVSLVNPYTAGGELLTVSTYFPDKFLGGTVQMVEPSVPIARAGILATGTFRGDVNSVTTAALQFFNSGLSATASAGVFVDNTVANLSTSTLTVEMVGY